MATHAGTINTLPPLEEATSFTGFLGTNQNGIKKPMATPDSWNCGGMGTGVNFHTPVDSIPELNDVI